MMLRYLLLLTSLFLTWPLLAEAMPGQPPATDFQGDPLPTGAVARLGSIRFRHDDTILFAAFLPSDKSVLSVSVDGMICIWEFPSGKRIKRFGTDDGAQRQAELNPKVTSAALSPDAKRLLIFSNDGALSIWDWANAKQLGTVTGAGRGPGTSGSPIYSADGKTILVIGSSRVMHFVDVASGKEVDHSAGHGGPLESIAFSADGKQIITADAKSTHQWDAATGKEISSVALPVRKVEKSKGGKKGKASVAGKAVGGMVATTFISPDGRISLEVATFAGPAIAQAAAARDAVFIDNATGKELGKIGLEVVEITPRYRKPLVFSPDSKILAVVAGNARVRIDLYEVPTGKLMRSVDAGPPGPVPAGPLAIQQPNAPNPAPVPIQPNMVGKIITPLTQKLIFSHDGRFLFFQFDPTCAIVIVDSVTAKQLGSLPANTGQMALDNIFSPDGRNLFVDLNDGTFQMHELATGEPRHTFGTKLPPLPGGEQVKVGGFGPFFGDAYDGSESAAKRRVISAFSPDLKLLALTGPQGAVHIWDLLTGKELAVLKGHTAPVTGLAFAPHGQTLASASEDATALIWDMTKMQRPAPAGKAPLPADLENWWQIMAETDGAKAFAAMVRFAETPEQSLAWLKEHVKPAPPLDQEHVAALMAQLDDNKYQAREAATNELIKIGEPILPVLDKVLGKKQSQEIRTRLESIRGKLTALRLEGDRLRVYRTVELLEILGTQAARQYLETLAAGALAALVTESAKEALRQEQMRKKR